MVINLLPPLIYSRSTSLISLESLPLRSILIVGTVLVEYVGAKRSVPRINVGMQRRRLNTFWSWIYICVYVSYIEVNKGSICFLVSFEQKRIAALCSGLMV